MQAMFNDEVIAESNETVVVEGNHYFPADSVRVDVLAATDRQTSCYWKGIASYYDVTVGDETAGHAAWYYPEPLEKASHIKDYIAFYPAVTVRES